MTPNLSELVKSLEWQSIKSAPRDGTVILGRNKNDPYDTQGSNVLWYNGSYESHWVYEADTDPVKGLTHWMPLPAGNAGEVIRALVAGLQQILDIAACHGAGVFADPAAHALQRAEKLAGGRGS